MLVRTIIKLNTLYANWKINLFLKGVCFLCFCFFGFAFHPWFCSKSLSYSVFTYIDLVWKEMTRNVLQHAPAPLTQASCFLLSSKM